MCKGDGCKSINCHLFAGIVGLSLEAIKLENSMVMDSACHGIYIKDIN